METSNEPSMPLRNRGTMHKCFQSGVPEYYKTLSQVRKHNQEYFKDDLEFRRGFFDKNFEKASNNFQTNTERSLKSSISAKKVKRARQDVTPNGAAFVDRSNEDNIETPPESPAAESPTESPPLIHDAMADTSSLRKMGLYDLCVPISGERRRVVLYIKSGIGHYDKAFQALLEKHKGDLRYYKVKFRFPGDKRDAIYSCVEGFLTKGPEAPFSKFMNEEAFCDQVFVTRVLSQTLTVEIPVQSEMVHFVCSLADAFLDRKIMVFCPFVAVESFTSIFRNLAQAGGQRNQITACLLDEYSPDSIQVCQILLAWKEQKSRERQGADYKANQRQQGKKKAA